MIPDGRRVCVIEPHADDAFLSLGTSIRGWVREGRAVEVLTVYSDDEFRAGQTEAWAAHVGAGWTALGQVAATVEGFTLPELVDPLTQPLLPERWSGDDVVRIWPLGVAHPEHAVVAAAAHDGDLHYLDMPYHLVDAFAAEVTERLHGRSVVSWTPAGRAKWDDVRFYLPELQALEPVFGFDALALVPEVVVTGMPA